MSEIEGVDLPPKVAVSNGVGVCSLECNKQYIIFIYF